jgi:hypothetical protein
MARKQGDPIADFLLLLLILGILVGPNVIPIFFLLVL